MKTKWVIAEVDRITALFYFVVIISLFIFASLSYPDFLQHFTLGFASVQSTIAAILIFTFAALIAAIVMLILRIRGLLTKASTAFKYLTALGAIKIEKENFRITLQEIERYLNNDDWVLAEYWVKRIQWEYTVDFLTRIKEGQKP